MKLLDIPFVRPIAIVIVVGLLTLIGVFEYTTMKYELLPPMDINNLTVQTTYPGASPSEVEEQVTKKIEDAVSGVARVKHVTSQSFENVSIVALEFTPKTVMSDALQDVRRVVNAKMSDLPSAVKTPVVSKISLDDYPIIQIAVTANAGAGELYSIAKDVVKPRLSRIGGVGQVSMLGGNARQIKVSLVQAKLEQYNVPIGLVLQKISSSNLDFPAGSIKAVDGQYVVRITGKLKNLDELRGLVLSAAAGAGRVRLGDVAHVEDSIADSETIFRYNGKDAIGVIILKQAGANAVEVSRQVHAELDKIGREYKDKNIKVTYADDTSVFTIGSANDVVHDILLAVVFVGIIILVFLHDLRNAFAVMMSIPVTLLSTIICMALGDFTLNLMSLLAITLVIGILVDDSIVVIENIHRHKTEGKTALEASRFGAREIGFAASSVTLVIIVAFLPVSLSGGIIGSLLLQFGMTIVIATGISLIVSLTLTPLLASRFKHAEGGKRNAYDGFNDAFDRLFLRITDWFHLALDWAFAHKRTTVAASVGMLLLSFVLLGTGLVGSEFATQIDRGQFSVALELPERTTLAENDRIIAGIERKLRSRPEVANVYSKIGYDATSGTSNYKTSISVDLVARAKRQKSSVQVGTDVENELRRIPGIRVKVAQVGLVDSGSSSSPVAYDVVGPDYEQNLRVANEWAAVMREVPGTGDVRVSVSDGKPELQIGIDRIRLADLGLSLDSVGAALRTALTGDDSLYYHEAGKDYTMKVELNSFDRTDTELVKSLSFTNDQGRQIRLSQFASVKNAYGPTSLKRLDRQSAISVAGQAIGRPTGDIDKEIRAKGKRVGIPSDIEVRPSGSLTMQNDSFGSLGLALLLSVVLIYAILAILFDSLTYPLSVIFSLPFALIGGFIALAVSRQTLNIFSIMSMILLMGLAAKNAILLVDRALHNQHNEGMNPADSFREAVTTRIRPIFMTTLAMVFGMLPIALGLGSAGEMKQAMGVVLIGGLLFCLLITMVLVPVSFLVIEGLRNRIAKARSIIKLEKDNA